MKYIASLIFLFSVSDDRDKDGRIVNEEEQIKKRKLEDMNNMLGTREQPVLEKLRYQVNTNKTAR